MPAETHTTREPISSEEVFAIVKANLCEILEVAEDSILRESRFAEDLDADSLALIELVEALEEDFGERTVGFSVDDEDISDMKTVGDAVDYVIARLGSASA